MKTTDTHVYFFSIADIFSNWYAAPFVDAMGNKFANTEQAFMYYKAVFFGDSEIANMILAETNPAEVKKFGRAIRNFDTISWDLVKIGFMEYVNLLKYRQNEGLAQTLKETGSRVLAEASPYDKIWGVGLDANDPKILVEANWGGKNLLGYSLMKIRSLI